MENYKILINNQLYLGEILDDEVRNITQPLNYQTKGEIHYNDYRWEFNTESSLMTEFQFNNLSKISPPSNDYYVKFIPVSSMSKDQTIKLDDFHRKLVKGEVDDNIFIFISTNKNFEANLKIRIFTTDNQIIDSGNIKIIVVSPKNLAHEPF